MLVLKLLMLIAAMEYGKNISEPNFKKIFSKAIHIISLKNHS